MDVIIIHFHLNRGGVTRVIENHLRSLALAESDRPVERVTIVYGGRAVAWNPAIADELPFELSMVVVPELEYDDQAVGSKRSLFEALQDVLLNYDRDSTVLHIHNHSLGKNVALLQAIFDWANAGWRLLLHIHDFAEDMRPENYRHMVQEIGSAEGLQRKLYPQAPQVHYVVLNERDRSVLTQAGIVDERLHLLPNAVALLSNSGDSVRRSEGKQLVGDTYGTSIRSKYVLYPVRAIRRKNIAEFLLWSTLVEDSTFALTLAPLNPVELSRYQSCVQVARELQLPVMFEVGAKLTLEQNYATADAIITTSVAEGFGLVYLEASLAGLPLIGRSLPGIVDDFRKAGMSFPGLGDSVKIPNWAVEVDRVVEHHVRLAANLRHAFGMTTQDSGRVRAEVESGFAGDTVDFGRLDFSAQKTVLKRASAEASLRAEIRSLNPVIQAVATGVKQDLQATAIAENRRTIAQTYSLNVIGGKLIAIYDSLLSGNYRSATEDPKIAQSILDSFVQPRFIFPVRVD